MKSHKNTLQVFKGRHRLDATFTYRRDKEPFYHIMEWDMSSGRVLLQTTTKNQQHGNFYFYFLCRSASNFYCPKIDLNNPPVLFHSWFCYPQVSGGEKKKNFNWSVSRGHDGFRQIFRAIKPQEQIKGRYKASKFYTHVNYSRVCSCVINRPSSLEFHIAAESSMIYVCAECDECVCVCGFACVCVHARWHRRSCCIRTGSAAFSTSGGKKQAN